MVTLKSQFDLLNELALSSSLKFMHMQIILVSLLTGDCLGMNIYNEFLTKPTK